MKIFLSSVYREFPQERAGLIDQIRKLEALVVGMEYFGSNPESPKRYDHAKVEQSDLFVGLIGREYGSVDGESGRSFTELEYDAAMAKAIPCLIYFKDDSGIPGPTDGRQAQLRARVLREHVVSRFADLDDLKERFLIDFFRLSRGALSAKIGYDHRHPIPVAPLHALCKEHIDEQIRSISRGKYQHRLYVERAVQTQVDAFTDFETHYCTRVSEILAALSQASNNYPLPRLDPNALVRAREGLTRVTNPANAAPLLEGLRSGFYYAEVQRALQLIDTLIRPILPHEMDLRIARVARELIAMPFATASARTALPGILHELVSRVSVSGASQIQGSNLFQELMQFFPIVTDAQGRQVMANQFLDELDSLLTEHGRHCLALVDRAGRGKTNLACHLAESLVHRHPVILLSGQMELSSAYDVERHVQQQLEAGLAGVFSDWMNRISPGLEQEGKWLFIIIDGINENRNLPLLIQVLDHFIPRLTARRIRLLVTCRDIYWETFEPHFDGYLFGSAPLALGLFQDREWREAVTAYFCEFTIEAQLGEEATEALRNPLLMRFFCEANRARRIGFVGSLRLVEVLDLYVERISQAIAEALGLISPRPVLDFLLTMGRRLWEQRSNETSLESLGVTAQDAARTDSIYARIRSESVVLEQTSGRYGTRVRARFIYDEFMEYIIARSWLDGIEDDAAPRPAALSLVEQAGQSLETFPSALGAVQFLDQMRGESGRLVNRMIGRLSAGGDELFLSNQFVLIRALEAADTSVIDDDVLAVVDRLEQLARPEIKERIGPVVLRLLETAPDDPQLRCITKRILEIDEWGGDAGGVVNRPAEPHSPDIKAQVGPIALKLPDAILNNPPAALERLRARSALHLSAGTKDERTMRERLREAGQAAIAAGYSSPSLQLKASSYPDSAAPCLPPVRFHYADETKLNAIAVLVASGSGHNQGLLDQAITGLGRGELHSALRAVEALDGLVDAAVLDLLPRYLNESASEYRIYCAWLLRRRYGKRAADFLIGLLQDPESRVHRYTLTLFETRRIEEPLLVRLLGVINDPDRVAHWHLVNMLRVLGRRSQLDRPGLADIYRASVAASLERMLRHPAEGVRSEVLRAASQWLAEPEQRRLFASAGQDPDPQVARTAQRLGARINSANSGR